jgi:hypothetical protein
MVGDPTYGPGSIDINHAVRAGDGTCKEHHHHHDRDYDQRLALDKRAGRLLLHAHRLVLPLQLTLPEHYNEPLDVTARPPPDFAGFGVLLFGASPLDVAGPS